METRRILNAPVLGCTIVRSEEKMIRTVEGVIDTNGVVRLLETVPLTGRIARSGDDLG